jgi:hypothetical protein
MSKILNAAISRVKEKSTWAGILSLSALLGLKIEPELFSGISTAVIALVGLYEVVRKEKK